MHLGYVGYEQQYQLRGASGVAVWAGIAIIGKPYRAVNGGATAIPSGTACIIDTVDANTTLGRDDNLSTNDPIVEKISVLPTAGAASKGYLGVAVNQIPIPDSTGQFPRYGILAGPASLCTVLMSSAAGAIGDHITGAAAGLCGVLTPTTNVGLRIGMCIKAGTLMAASSPATYAAGILVNPF